MAKAGRKSKYRTHVEPFLARITAWCKAGALEKDLCKKLGISESALNDYKTRFPELSQAIIDGKMEPDDLVESTLLKRALGYTYEEVKTTSFADNKDSRRQLVIRTTHEVSADVRAMIFWLKNRRPQRWRDRSELGIDEAIPIRMIKEEEGL